MRIRNWPSHGGASTILGSNFHMRGRRCSMACRGCSGRWLVESSEGRGVEERDFGGEARRRGVSCLTVRQPACSSVFFFFVVIISFVFCHYYYFCLYHYYYFYMMCVVCCHSVKSVLLSSCNFFFFLSFVVVVVVIIIRAPFAPCA